MNNKSHKFKVIKRIVLLSFVLTLTNCQVDDTSTEQPNTNSGLQTVSVTEAKAFLSQSKNSTTSKLSDDGIENLGLDKITQEEINGSDQLLTVIPFSTNDELQNERILLIKINNEIKSVIFNMYRDEKSEQGVFSGKIFVYSLDGVFRDGYLVEKGVLTKQFVKSNLTARGTKRDIMDAFDIQSIDLDGLTVYGKPKLTNAYPFDMIVGGGSSPAGGGTIGDGMSWNTGGGSGGGGGGANSGPATMAVITEKQIDSDNLAPCPKEVLEQLKNATNMDIARMLTKLGVTTNYYKLTFKSGTITGGAVGNTTYTNKSIKNDYTVTITQDYTSGTKLFRAAVLLHELTHAYFLSIVDDYLTKGGGQSNYNINSLPSLFQAFCDKKYPPSDAVKANAHHEEMGNQYVNAIAASLQEYNTGIPVPTGSTPQQVYSDLAWGGLNGTPVFDSKFPVGSSERDRVLNRLGSEQTGRTLGSGTVNQQDPVGRPCN
jgi:hypothetical protein